MSKQLALYACLAFVGWLLYRDAKTRARVSLATWLPTLQLLVIGSRSVSTWLSGVSFDREGTEYSLDGSPMDRWVFIALIVGSLVVLQKRQLDWGAFFRENKALIFAYAYLALTVLWASAPFVSLKRWIKDFGNVLLVLVILTDGNPREAIRAVFVRCAYVLIPFSILLLRYYPDLGRHYSKWTGLMEAVGVTQQKNSLGAMVLVTGMMLAWDVLERLRLKPASQQKLDLGIRLGIFLLGGYLLKVSDSKTATVCLLGGAGIMASFKFEIVRRNAARALIYASIGAVVLYVADKMFSLTEMFVKSLGRDMTFTGRTNIWEELLKLRTDPIFGTGFINLWSDSNYLDRLPEFAKHSAHNGYLDLYLDGGLIACGLLGVVLLTFVRKIHRNLMVGGEYGFVRFAIFVTTVAYNLSESNFFRMTPPWFLALVGLIATARVRRAGVVKARQGGAEPGALPGGAPLQASYY